MDYTNPPAPDAQTFGDDEASTINNEERVYYGATGVWLFRDVAVPEPTTFGLLALSLLGVARRRRS